MARRALGPATLEVVNAVAKGTSAAMLVACSGGADSLALAAAAAVVAARRGCGVRAIIVDHGLQAGSAEVARAARSQLVGLGLAAEVTRVQVLPGAGPEAAARQARYAALIGAATTGEEILLGHTLDDQAETVLLGLARGSGTRSVAGMPAARGPFRRPLLGLRRTVTVQSCSELGLEPWQDPHNSQSRFARVRVRRRILPLLEDELGPGIAEALARTAQLARDDADLLDHWAAAAAAAFDPHAMDCAALAELPAALRSRVLRDWLLTAGAEEVSAAHLGRVADLVTDWHGQRWADLPGLRIRRSGGLLSAEPNRARPPAR